MYNKQAVMMCANVIGYDQRPKEYISWVKDNLNIDVSNATVTKTLGRYSERENTSLDNSLLIKARDFLVSCNSNVHYSKSLLERARAGLAGGSYV